MHVASICVGRSSRAGLFDSSWTSSFLRPPYCRKSVAAASALKCRDYHSRLDTITMRKLPNPNVNKQTWVERSSIPLIVIEVNKCNRTPDSTTRCYSRKASGQERGVVISAINYVFVFCRALGPILILPPGMKVMQDCTEMGLE